ncbi:MAG: alanine--glyoxylate aminotransferase family protein [Clostridiales bacterium]|nr:alanine--glyoxylate aminotransferase family protein [Clostridiales bacterium]MDU2293781.1 alanine--glyoxylate aminotransferase family protein [Peptococcus niger]MDU7505220.1 alanine--glyoxylate aminotransferase family protein [Clostridia bacterium]MBS5915183.1 alanine--glyoxylate aminotransferase family protein [Clostridiales bacterium]MDU1029447.1 alanine--glyoxylate aminotransferase family protein [Clostridiales bacterium]
MQIDHKQLFIPGPTEVLPDVLDEMARPLIGHRTKEISALQKAITEKLQKVFYTENLVLLSTSSGSGLMEASVRSCTAKRALCCAMGDFGKRWYKMAVANNVPADLLEVDLGKHVPAEAIREALATGQYDLLTTTHSETATGVANNLEEIAEVVRDFPEIVWCVDGVSSAGGMKIEVDRLGIDILLTSTHKALALPPGMAVCTMSQKAYDRTAEVDHRGVYFDLRAIYDRITKKNYQYPSTPNVSLMYAMDKQLDHILAEGLDARFARHQAMADRCRAWAKEHFDLFPEEGYMATTLTVILNTRGISVADLNKALGERGKTMSNGYGDLKEKTFRIAHLGEVTMDDLNALLADIEDILGL